jgi:acetylornithine deacetylase/succinyl-diaminopimelate desuccinylase-like protein
MIAVMKDFPALRERLRQGVQRDRLVETAIQLIAVPSRTGEAGNVAATLADILLRDGFAVDRPDGGHRVAPAVVTRYAARRPGRTLQYNGHLDTVHLPFVPPAIVDGRMTGSGSSDMKAGIAAALEAMRVLRDLDLLPAGSILFTAHDLHESPWGDGRQLDALIRAGVHGDAVLIPEYLNQCLPVVGRGGLIWRARISRAGGPVHEVMRPDEPNVIAAGAEAIARLGRLNTQLAAKSDPLAGSESLFVGQIHSGEIYNQYPQQCLVEGTRRWLPGTQHADVENELRRLFGDVARDTAATIDLEFSPMRDAFRLDPADPLVSSFQTSYETVVGQRLPLGAKPFVDDGNSFWALADVPAITHGPQAGGAHTLNEWVSIDDLERVALVYALTAVMYCES